MHKFLYAALCWFFQNEEEIVMRKLEVYIKSAEVKGG